MQRSPLFLLLLPVFYVLHVCNEFYGIISLAIAVKFILFILLAEAIVMCACWLYFRDRLKAAVFTFILFSAYLFFGTVKDLVRYRIIIPALLILFLLLLFYLKRTGIRFQKLFLYLNLLLLILAAVSVFQFRNSLDHAKNGLAEKRVEKFVKCDSCNKPDIYFIILDEYSGRRSLENKMDFSNDAFISGLEQRGFKIISSSSSNYNSTPFSIASMLEMNYLPLKMESKEAGNLPLALYTICNNRFTSVLKKQGYDIINLSSLTINESNGLIKEGFIPSPMRILNGQTLTGRLARDIRYDLITGKKQNNRMLKNIIYKEKENNEEIIRHMVSSNQHPAFILAHLMLPHSPFYYDSAGNLRSLTLLTKKGENEKAYLDYLKYANGKILSITDSILLRSARPPVIVLVSDHGYRRHNDPMDSLTCFNNLMAIYLPDSNYIGFYQSMSDVNLGRILVNKLFAQQWPLLKDSSVYLWKPD